MYPHTFLSLFPPFPRNDNVFVAMSFDKSLKLRFEAVIQPAIEKAGLKAIVVRKSTISDSILTEILSGISDSRLVLVDLTGPAGSGKTSPNVMYEMGIAHAVRQPAEVILFRSDTGDIPFDMTNVRVNQY